MVSSRYRPLWQGLGAFLVLLLTCVLLYSALWALDFVTASGVNTPADLVADPAIADAVSGLPEVTVAVLGIAITVVAIIVELASNRYTPRISEMFVREPVNAGVLGLYVVTTVLVFWTDLSLHGEVHPTNMILFTLSCVSVSLITVLPYLSYVFGFLHPHQIVVRIERMGTDAIGVARRGRRIPEMRRRLADSAGQLGELACNSVEKHDKSLALAAVDSLAALGLASVEARGHLPESWYADIGSVARDSDFVALHDTMVDNLARRQTWVEMKVLRQYESTFRVALNRQRDVCHVAAVHTRRLGLAAHQAGHPDGLELAYRFLNTYLRACVVEDDIRTGYNVFAEYRELTAGVMSEQTRDQVETACRRFQYYGQFAFRPAVASCSRPRPTTSAPCSSAPGSSTSPTRTRCWASSSTSIANPTPPWAPRRPRCVACARPRSRSPPSTWTRATQREPGGSSRTCATKHRNASTASAGSSATSPRASSGR